MVSTLKKNRVHMLFVIIMLIQFSLKIVKCDNNDKGYFPKTLKFMMDTNIGKISTSASNLDYVNNVTTSRQPNAEPRFIKAKLKKVLHKTRGLSNKILSVFHKLQPELALGGCLIKYTQNAHPEFARQFSVGNILRLITKYFTKMTTTMNSYMETTDYYQNTVTEQNRIAGKIKDMTAGDYLYMYQKNSHQLHTLYNQPQQYPYNKRSIDSHFDQMGDDNKFLKFYTEIINKTLTIVAEEQSKMKTKRQVKLFKLFNELDHYLNKHNGNVFMKEIGETFKEYFFVNGNSRKFTGYQHPIPSDPTPLATKLNINSFNYLKSIKRSDDLSDVSLDSNNFFDNQPAGSEYKPAYNIDDSYGVVDGNPPDGIGDIQINVDDNQTPININFQEFVNNMSTDNVVLEYLGFVEPALNSFTVFKCAKVYAFASFVRTVQTYLF